MVDTQLKWPKTPKMTKQDFAYIARIIADTDDPESLAILFAYHLKDTNVRFQRQKFIDACLSRQGRPQRRGSHMNDTATSGPHRDGQNEAEGSQGGCPSESR